MMDNFVYRIMQLRANRLATSNLSKSYKNTEKQITSIYGKLEFSKPNAKFDFFAQG